MSDIGSRLPMKMNDIVETDDMIRKWIESRLFENKSKIAALQRQILAAEQDLAQCEARLKMLDNVVDTTAVEK